MADITKPGAGMREYVCDEPGCAATTVSSRGFVAPGIKERSGWFICKVDERMMHYCARCAPAAVARENARPILSRIEITRKASQVAKVLELALGGRTPAQIAKVVRVHRIPAILTEHGWPDEEKVRSMLAELRLLGDMPVTFEVTTKRRRKQRPVPA